MRRDRARFIPLAAISAAAALGVAACGTGSAGSGTSIGLTANAANPITIGISLPLTGADQADGLATQNGYELWASDVNRNGGLLGRMVKLKILDDKTDPVLAGRQYQTLITADHVDLTMAPFSTLLSVPAAQATEKLHYVLPAGAATGPAAYALKDPYFFSTSVPDAEEMQPFVDWVKTLTGPGRPRTAAYPQVLDPFADPPVQLTQKELAAAGISTVYSNARNPVANPTTSALTRVAQAVANKNPDIVVLGSVDIPSLLAFVHTWQAMNYTPRIFIAASGPDQGQAFLNAVGRNGAEADMVPNGWYGQEQNALSHVMVQDYIAKFGGTSSDINADVAEAYSAGEVLADAVTATHGTSNAAIAQYLHTHTLQTVQGPATFDSRGENTAAIHQAGIFQWQNGHFLQVLPHTGNMTPPESVKPRW